MIREIFSKKITIAVLLFLIIGCNSDSDKQIVMHPIVEKIPFSNTDEEHLKIRKNSDDQLKTESYTVFSLLEKYFENHDLSEFEKAKVDLNVSDFNSLYTEVLNEHRLIILDTHDQQLIEYDFDNDERYELATQGRGPGDILNTQELVRVENKLFVVMSDMRISIFNCSDIPCSFENNLQLNNISPQSIAVISDNTLAVLGYTPVTHSSGTEIKDKSKNKSVSIIDSTGQVLNSFGRIYDYGNHWMLERPFIEGIVRYVEDGNKYILSYKRFPFIYVYNTTLNLERVFEIDEFILGKQEYNNKTGELKIIEGDHSILQKIIPIDKNVFLVVVNNLKNRRVENSRYVWDEAQDFYVLDFQSQDFFFLGSDKKLGSFRNILVDRYGILAEKENEIFWINGAKK